MAAASTARPSAAERIPSPSISRSGIQSPTSAARRSTDEVELYPASGTLSTWSLDPTTGIVTFESAPTGTPTADFEFHYAVRFDSDTLAMIAEESYVRGGRAVISLSNLNLVEVKGPNF